jgi:hypothetical protein
MKQYVLDHPVPAEPIPAAPVGDFVPPTSPSPWRPLAVLVVVEGIALALLYLALVGSPEPRQAISGGGPAYVAAFAFPEAPPTQAAPAEPELPPSHITHVRGRYVVELNGSELGPALAMLTAATGATVRGGEVLAGNSARLTKVFETDSPVEAWQAVFGGVANFAVACQKGTCAVRFVAPAEPGRTAFAPTQPAGAAVEAVAFEAETPLPGVDANVAAAPPSPAANQVQSGDSQSSEN